MIVIFHLPHNVIYDAYHDMSYTPRVGEEIVLEDGVTHATFTVDHVRATYANSGNFNLYAITTLDVYLK
jgi:hypothetical protein